MLRTHSRVRALSPADRESARDVCALDPVTNVFVAARIAESGLFATRGSLLGFSEHGELQGLCWASANVVPAECTPGMMEAFAHKVRRRRHLCSSLFGPADQVFGLWEQLQAGWGPAREVRPDQPVMTMATNPRDLGVPIDGAVRPATTLEVDLVTPAAVAMFTEEIGYPPYSGSDTAYRAGVADLIGRGQTFVRVEDGRVIFKADVGALAGGVAQIQGVWVDPDRRGLGLAVPAMAAVVEQVIAHLAPVVTLYVNDYNAPAIATYRRVGFTRTGTFATVLL